MVKDSRLYDIIGVNPEATVSEIKRGYRIRALSLHPDKNNNDDLSKERFQELQRAYEILRNEESRKIYDETGIIEGEVNINFDNIVEFFNSFSKKITIEDIESYRRYYRGSEEEWEDITNFYLRFDGSCENLLEYIPFSEPTDIAYYLSLIERAVMDGTLPFKTQFQPSKKKLEDKARKYINSRRQNAGEEDHTSKLIRELRERSMKRIGIISEIIAKHEGGYPKDMDEEVYETLYDEMVKDSASVTR
ncbi:hypothetical protein FG386_000396 [Cryptosporidium ryanae]|uniref:uncharacterized protein n=1 Tax=Cryptosporidium ryanae TaxID=515981 RepID=UPI003519F43B|nr:hypothetical protein FG386_000396 [Cryptosporidium ryanae]